MNVISRLFRYFTFALALLGIVMMASVLQTLRGQETGTIAPPPIDPPKKPFEKTVAATGIIEALNENVSIGVPIPGLVLEIPEKIVVNANVSKGEPLFRLDDRELQATLIKQRAAVAVANANIAVQKATLAKNQDQLDRLTSVTDARAISKDDLINRTNDVSVSKAQLLAAEAQLKSAEADSRQTELLLERLTVKSPRDGVILQVNIREGEYASTQPKAPVMIIGEQGKLQVRADVDEQNAMNVKPKKDGFAYVKGDSATRIPLSFSRIEPFVIPKVSLTGASTERVDTRVLQVIFSIQLPADWPKDKRLYVGQQVDVFIDDTPSPHIP
jgi:multidrug efflux pump subunit AcrA (membrane-fusion protein)